MPMSLVRHFFFASCIYTLAIGACFAQATQAVSAASAAIETQAPGDLPAQESEASPPVDIWDRVRRGYAMPDLKTKRVTSTLRVYQRNARSIEQVFARSGKYLYHIIEEVEKRGMPTELALLPFVESGFQPEALSHAKAAGLWQFMPATGKIYALQQNMWRDDRRDVLSSTRAALEYLQKLYDQFGDWHLALAAYNWGEGNVTRAIRRAKARKQRTDYAHLRMPKETANYVPRLQAFKEIVRNPDKYGIKLPEIDNAPYFVRVVKSRDIDLKTAAELAEMDLEEFKQLNPGYNLPVIVASHDSTILIPIENVEIFMDNLASWVNTGKPLSSWVLYRVKQRETVASIAKKTGMSQDAIMRVNRIPKGRALLPGSTLLIDAKGQKAPAIALEELDARIRLDQPEKRRVVYRVRKGDTIYAIARKYGITQNSIRKGNNLRTSRLRIGQRLVLTIPPKGITQPKAGKNVHIVRRGETLSSIAKRYRTTVSQIRTLNHLRTTRISIGQRLRIR